ncbi:nucleotidyltransferase family protein [Polynucleobacter sp. IMCC30063]|uniref:nucleotidyltransferase family protein n=1 Tax=Polynucleobacter sp. IMCC30063 TaxID=2907298 RepID=UPI001F3881DC|nr:nucleotidyltransferase family protein [Polynucleobacter sp. IMCC30063]MCE7505368.1 nucleotidyltransferase family protein [Polynucleobacter sp. IMCC30063]
MRIGAVLLAAGQGSRIGGLPKALLKLQGLSFLEHHLTALYAVGVSEVVVVTGYYYQSVETIAQLFPVQVVRNSTPELGQASSVRLGIEALGSEFDVIIMLLCDQPFIGRAELTLLLEEFSQLANLKGGLSSAPEIILIPEVAGQRGNPVLFSGAVMRAILASTEQLSCRQYADLHPELITFLKTDHAHFVIDIDTPEDLNILTQKTP